nr:Zinc finger, RING/FYVE/PHD-type [Ipomoea batatas]
MSRTKFGRQEMTQSGKLRCLCRGGSGKQLLTRWRSGVLLLADAWMQQAEVLYCHERPFASLYVFTDGENDGMQGGSHMAKRVRELCRKEVKMSGLVMALTLDHLFDHDTALAALGPENSGGVKVAAPELATVMACDGVCTVCMEGFRSGIGGKQAPCGHIFHANCILKWLSLHNSCPLCRSPITGKLPL